jgi:hypothetical protein
LKYDPGGTLQNENLYHFLLPQNYHILFLIDFFSSTSNFKFFTWQMLEVQLFCH